MKASEALVITLIAVCSVFTSRGGEPDDAFVRRAARSFDNEDWSSAQAMYGVLTERQPNDPTMYARAIVASEMTCDSVYSHTMLERAMSHGVALDSILDQIRRTATAQGCPDTYAAFLLRSQRSLPWLARAIDARLLDYYLFRHDAAKTAVYAGRMLAGVPENIGFLLILARAQTAMGDTESASASYSRILEIDSDNYDALVELGSTLYDSAPGRAGELLARAYAVRPTPYVAKLLQQLR